MAKPRIELNKKGVRELLNSREVKREMRRRAQNIAREAGPGFEVEDDVSKDRVRSTVVSRTQQARRAEAENRALTRAIRAGER